MAVFFGSLRRSRDKMVRALDTGQDRWPLYFPLDSDISTGGGARRAHFYLTRPDSYGTSMEDQLILFHLDTTASTTDQIRGM